MVVEMIVLALMVGCSPETQKQESIFSINLEEYHMLSDFKSWTYRDDMPETEDDLPDEARLMLAQNQEGVVEFRRGSRWVEANPIGQMGWSFDDGLSLDSWDLPMGSGSGPIVLSDADPEDGESITQGDWTCVLSQPDNMWTWYAVYDYVLYFDCDSSNQAFDIFFAKEAGLIHFQTETYELDLVAPW